MVFVPGTVKFFAEIFSENYSLDDSGIFLFVFPSITNLKLHSIPVNLNTVKCIPSLYSSKASSSDCILVAVLNNCEPKLSYVLADLFKICL